jgi:CBS-domain-containing membrane protein
LAAALSLSLTGALMVLLDVSHPPAGATTLIVSLGIISKPLELVIIEVAVFVLVAQALVINRLAGLPYSWWNAADS